MPDRTTIVKRSHSLTPPLPPFPSPSPTDIKPEITFTTMTTPDFDFKKPFTSSKKKSKSKITTPSSNKSSTSPGGRKSEGWTPEMRLKLFEKFVELADVKWDEVAIKMGNGYTGKQCREQWQRATGKKIKKALAEE